MVFGVGVDEIISIVKKVLEAIAKWIWDRLKDWVMANWQIATIAILGLFVVFLVRIILTGLSFSAFQRLLSPKPQG